MATITLFVLLMGFYTESYYWALGLIWIAAMGWSRYEKRCHSVEQISGGVLTGMVGFMIASSAHWLFKSYDFMKLTMNLYTI